MPSWPVHLALANKINKKLNLGDEFIVGNVFPDILEGYEIENPSQLTEKKVNHFLSGKTIDVDAFINSYKDDLAEPLVKGYLAHLMTDKYFNNYFFENHTVFINDERAIILKNGMVKTNLDEKPWQTKQKDFGLFGQKLINDGLLPMVDTNMVIDNKIKECPINNEDLTKTINKINSLKENKNGYDSDNYIMFTEEELDSLYENCYNYILEKLSNIESK